MRHNFPKTERNAQIVEAYKRGKTATSIACDFQISYQRVCQILNRERNAKRFRAEERGKRNALILEAYKRGSKTSEIAREFGISTTSVHYVLTVATDTGSTLDIKYWQEAEDAKRCTRCGIIKPIGDFHRSPRGRKGRYGWCKKCVNANKKAQRDNAKAETSQAQP